MIFIGRLELGNPKTSVNIIVPVDRTASAFFGHSSMGEVHYSDCSLISGLYQWIHVSSTITKQSKNSIGLQDNSVKHCCEVVSRRRLRLTACSSAIFQKEYDPRGLLRCLRSRTENWKTVNARSWTFVASSSVLTVF